MFKCDPRIRPRSKDRKPLKRPALRGDVIRAGITCDARLLSCSFFEPSALPLPGAFCRSPAWLNRTLSRAESVAGRLGDLRASGVFSALILKFQGAKPFLATTARKFPDSAFQSLRGIRMPPRPQECRKPPYNAKPGPSQIWAVSRTESGIY